MGDLSKRFSRWEFACRCGCGQDTIDYELINVLEGLADMLNMSYVGRIIVNVSSGNRCVNHNAAEGGKTNSQHLLGRAADVWFQVEFEGKREEIPVRIVKLVCEEIFRGKYGIGYYPNHPDQPFIHIDTRQNYARWDG